MKKVLTVLLVIAVMFTFSFGSAFAASPSPASDNAKDSQDAFSKLVEDALKTLSYNGDGYLTNDMRQNNANGYLSKEAIEAYSAILENEYLTKIGNAKSDWDGVWTEVNTEQKYVEKVFVGDYCWEYQADLEKTKAYDALATDLSGYSKAAKEAIQLVIEQQTVVLENAIANYEKDGRNVTFINASRDVVTAVKTELKKYDTAADDTKTIAKAKDAAVKALNEKAPDFYEDAEEQYKNAVTPADASKKATLTSDYDKMVQYFEDVIDATVLNEEDPDMDTAAEVVAEFNAIKNAINWTFQNTDNFYENLEHLKEADLFKSLAKDDADDALTIRKPDGTLLYYAKDVEKALDDALEAIDDALYAGMVHSNWTGFDANLAKLTIGTGEYALKAYKAAAITSITTGDYALTNWSDERADKVEALQDDYTDKILMAETVADVDALVEEAEDALDAILTTAQITALKNKTDARINALGYNDVLAKYYDAIVGTKGYTATTKADAVKAAKDLIKDAVIAKENAKLTYAEIDQIIKENREAAIAKVTDVKTKDELKTMADALAAQFKALPTTVTLADKDTILAAQEAFDAYLELAGTKKTDVNNTYLLADAMTDLMNLEAKAVNNQIKALPKTITIADAEAVEAARAAYKALETTYGDYDNEKDFSYLNAKIQEKVTKYSTLVKAEADLEKAKIADAAAKITALTADASVAEIEAAKAAFDALKLESKLNFNDELYAKLVNAVNNINKLHAEAVEALKITAKSTVKKGSITVKWTVVGDTSNIDGYEIWKSTKANKGYGKKPVFKTTKQSYKNTKGLTKGTRYYYKVRAYKVVDGVKYYSDYSNKAYRVAK